MTTRPRGAPGGAPLDVDDRGELAALRAMVAAAPIGLGILDPDLRYVLINDALAEINGLPVAAHLGRSVEEVLPGLEPRVVETLRRVVDTGEPVVDVEMSGETPSLPGVTRRWLSSYYPYRVSDGQSRGVVLVVTEITERVRLRAEADEQTRRAQLLAGFLDPLVGDAEDRILDAAAQRAAELIGDVSIAVRRTIERTELETVAVAASDPDRGEAFRLAFEAGRLGEAEKLVGEALRTAATVHRPTLPEVGLGPRGIATAGGPGAEQFPIRLEGFIAAPLRSNDGVFGAIAVARTGGGPPYTDHDRQGLETLASATSLTLDAERTHRALAESLARLETIVGESPVATVLLDRQLRVQLWNRACEEMFGWTEAEVLGNPPPITPEALRDEFDEIRRRTLSGERILGLETRRRRKDGRELDVAVYDVPYRDASGEIVGIVLRMIDIGDRRRLEEQLLQAQKMESVGRLAGGVAHDFNNILTAIIGHAELALFDMPSGAAGRDNVAAIRASAERAAGLTAQLLAFSRRQLLALQELDINEIVLSMEVLLRRLIGEDIELTISVDPRAGAIRADPTQLQQVLLNLAVNARDAMPDGGRLVIRTERVVFDEAYVARHLDVAAGQYAMVAVSDTGVGMDEETRQHIFEPFFTTKEPGKGTGLGLATTHGIVRQSGGYIYFYSEPGHGTTFKLYFASVGPSADRAAPATPLPDATGRGTILVVEDEPSLRELARAVLSRRGYDLLLAANGNEAIDLAEAHDGAIDLLISDVVMPGMRGPDLAVRLLERRPEMRVLLVSGYTEDALDRSGALSGTAFLAKPFTPQTLARKVAEVLTPPAERGDELGRGRPSSGRAEPAE